MLLPVVLDVRWNQLTWCRMCSPVVMAVCLHEEAYYTFSNNNIMALVLDWHICWMCRMLATARQDGLLGTQDFRRTYLWVAMARLASAKATMAVLGTRRTWHVLL